MPRAKINFALLAALLFMSSSVTSAPAACRLLPLPNNIFARGTPYVSIRKKLLAAGYRPSVDRTDSAYCNPPEPFEGHTVQCKAVPETEDCSGTGEGDCWLRLKDQAGNLLIVKTAGDGDPTTDRVIDWHLYCRSELRGSTTWIDFWAPGQHIGGKIYRGP